MAVKGLKRKRPSTADGGAVKKQCTEVVKGLAKADLPHPVKEILKLAAPFALKTYADERHPHQVSLVAMIDEALKGVQASQQQKVQDCQALVSSKDAEKAKREEAVLQVGKELMGSKIAAANKEYQVYEATQAFAKAAAALKETKKDQKVGDKAYARLEESKAEFEQIKARILEAKKTKYGSKQCTALEADFQFYGLETSLVESLHLVLAKDPAERSEFDGTIMSNLDAALAAASANLDGKLAEEAPAKKAREDVMATAQSANDSAKEKLAALNEELEVANRNVTESQRHVSATEGALKKYPSDMDAADSHLTDAQDELAAFMATFHTFNALKDRTVPPPPPPEPEANAPAPVAS